MSFARAADAPHKTPSATNKLIPNRGPIVLAIRAVLILRSSLIALTMTSPSPNVSNAIAHALRSLTMALSAHYWTSG
jgi:hypothetical protein